MKYTERAKYALAIARAKQFLDRIEELIAAGDSEAAMQMWERIPEGARRKLEEMEAALANSYAESI